MSWNASSGQQAAMPVSSPGPRAMSAQYSITQGAATHVALDITGLTEIAVMGVKFGVLNTEYMELQISPDNGTTWRTLKTYPTATLNQANGFYDVVPVRGTQVRVYGYNTQAGIGVNARFYI